MKTKSPAMKHAALATLLLGLSPALIAETSMETRDQKQQGQSAANSAQSQKDASENRMNSLRQAPEDPRGRYGSDLIGMDVYGAGGEQIGDLNDFIVDSQSGKIAYAVVASGGVLGIGAELRAVPISACSQSGERITVNIAQQKWEQAPVFTKDQLPSLGQDARGKAIHEYYGQKAGEPAKNSGQFALVSEIRGKEVHANQQQVGEIDDVVVRMESRTIAALLDPNDDFAGTDQKFIVPLNKLQNFNQDTLGTRLTRQDFARATPSMDDSWADAGTGYVSTLYIWPVYVGDQSGDMANKNATQRDNQAQASAKHGDRATIETVRRAVQSELPSSAQTVSIVAEKDKLVLRGTVPSEDVKERVEDRAENAAQGWDVESELRVASTNR